MTIRLRVILGFLFTIIVMAAGTMPFMVMTMRNNAEESYISNSSTQLRIMNNYVETFISGAERDVALLAQDLNGNSTRGDVILENSRGSLVLGGTRLVAGIGLDDLIVVDTPDALLICRKNQVGEVRKLVARLKEEGRADLV